MPYIRKKSAAKLTKVKYKYRKRTHKYGIKIPKYMVKAYKSNAENRNNYRHNSIKQGMENIGVSFKAIKIASDKLAGFR